MSLGAATAKARAPESLCSAAREATAVRSWSFTKRSPHSLQLEKARAWQQKTGTAETVLNWVGTGETQFIWKAILELKRSELPAPNYLPDWVPHGTLGCGTNLLVILNTKRVG